LDRHEVEILFSVIRSLKERGIGILLITHFLDQVYEISDRITVLRNGRKVGEHQTRELAKMKLVSEMLGKELTEELGTEDKQQAREGTDREVFLRVQGFARHGMMEPFDLDVKKGEIVGLAGLLGSGRTETAHLIFGIEKSERGKAYVKGQKARLSSPQKAIRYGFGLCPEDRKIEGIIADLTVRENIIIALQAKLGWFKYLSYKKQKQLAQEMLQALRIVTSDADTPVKELSGGISKRLFWRAG
jgi:monosaccharide-transporting ATPase